MITRQVSSMPFNDRLLASEVFVALSTAYKKHNRKVRRREAEAGMDDDA
jgi:hypothetical protein